MRKVLFIFTIVFVAIGLFSCSFDTDINVVCDHNYSSKTTGGVVTYKNGEYEITEQVKVTKTCTKCGDTKAEKMDPTIEGLDYLSYDNTVYLEDDDDKITKVVVPAVFITNGEPKTITKIDLNACAFNVDTVYLNESLTTIADFCFYQCYFLEEVAIPAKATVGEGAFSCCTGLSKLEFNDEVNLSASSFGGCTALKGLDSSIVSANLESFNECHLLLKELH